MTATFVRTAPESGIHSHEHLASWLADDLDAVRDIRALDRIAAFVATMEGRLRDARTVARPEWLDRLQAVLEATRHGDDATRLALLNHGLRELFAATTLTPVQYAAHAESLRNGESLAYRLKAREPLPMMDAIAVMESDPRAPLQHERAALLASAALRLRPLETRYDSVPLTGNCLVPGETVDTVADADPESRLLLLVHGEAFIVHLGAAGDEVTAGELAHLFLQARQLAEGAPSALRGRVARMVTGARRPTCHEVRERLALDATNARSLALVEGCRFAVCLDSPADLVPSPDLDPDITPLEAISRRLFGKPGNRWFGMTMFVIDAEAQAGIIISYNRGIGAVTTSAHSETLYRETLQADLASVRGAPAGTRSARLERIPFAPVALENLEAKADRETAAGFHHDRAFFDLDIGLRHFKALKVNPNAGLQYLLMLAAHDVYGGTTLPSISHGVSTLGGSGMKGGLDWVQVSTKGVRDFLEFPTDAERLDAAIAASNRHARRATECREGYSPSYFLKRPEGELDTLLYRFLFEFGSEYASEYRGYLFRATRWAGSMDILTSNVRLPDGIRYIGRPGATHDLVTLFGLHILMRKDSMSLFFIPNPKHPDLPRKIHAALVSMVRRALAVTQAVHVEEAEPTNEAG